MATLNNILLPMLRSESKDVAKMSELRQKKTAGYLCYSNATWVILLNKAGSNKYINTYLIFIRVLLLRVRLVCSRYMGKVRPEHKDFCCASQIGHLTTLFLLFRTEAKGKKGMSKVSKDVLRVYCTKD